MTPDGRNPGPNADNNIPVLTEIVELETQVPAQAPPVQAPPPHAAAAATIVDSSEQAEQLGAEHDGQQQADDQHAH
ncbi:hypothetical protein ACQCQ7_15660, partial [Ralstonia pseudosolanacearum]